MHTQSLEQQLNPLQQPAKEILNLNLKTIQQFKYLNPVELMNIKKPEEILEKNMELLIENGHHALNYVYSVFHIMENNWFKVSSNLMEDTQVHMDNTQKSIRNNVNELVNATHKTVNKTASSSKRITASSKRPPRSVRAKASKASNVNELVNPTHKPVKKAASSSKRNTASSKRPPRSVSAKASKASVVRVHTAKKNVSSSATKSRKPELRA